MEGFSDLWVDPGKLQQISEGLKVRGATSKLIKRFKMTGEIGQTEQDENSTYTLLLGPGNQLLTNNGEATA